jgi:hypothetical protein
VYCIDQTVDSQNIPSYRATDAKTKPVLLQTKLMIASYSTRDMYNFGGNRRG